MKGPPPIPTVLKMLRNNPGKRSLNKLEPHPEALSTIVPRELEDPEAQKEWRRTIVPAIRIGQITQADRLMAISHCELWATWRSQLAAAARHQHVVAVGKHNHPIPNPARVMANKTLQLAIKVDAELGLTPASRSRVTATPPQSTANPLERFLRKA